ncbi:MULTISPECIES: ankyrin repeat domain-containing protein [Marinomonas]|uniref:ankyrin repeat domain-containing protein n=1 Tax=Marinomonas TaxID=28253 RepID=UPI000DA228EB|nr:MULTISPECIES: ankyrin repeat domain-containing protein [Marinomonas]
MNISFSKLTKPCALILLLILTGCSSQPALISATRNNDVAEVESLLSYGYNPNVRNYTESYDNGRTPVYYAAEGGYNSLVKKLIAAGADVNQASDEQWTPLLAAARYSGNLETIRILVEADADIHFTNNYGRNVLMLATYMGKADVVQYLLGLGMDPEIKNNDGNNSYDYAKNNKDISSDMIHQYREAYLLKQKMAGIENRIKEIEARDEGLPESLKRDKYLIAYTDALKQEEYLDAVIYANLLDKLDTPMEDAFYYFWGEALLKLEDPEQAKSKLNEYLKRTGSGGKYYTQALRLIIQAEA